MSGEGRPRPGLPRWIEAPAAAALLAVFSPLLALLALAVRLGSPGPAFFRQERVGRGGVPFTLYKLRTMRHSVVAPTGGATVTAGGDPRITRLGRFLRASKLDELPQLLNILRGELSFVGPRPEVPSMVDLGDERWRRVLAARPGLTDPVTLRLRHEEALLAAVPGDREEFYRRKLQPFKLAGYADYLERRDAGSDIEILLRTVLAVIAPFQAPAPTVAEIEAGWRPL